MWSGEVPVEQAAVVGQGGGAGGMVGAPDEPGSVRRIEGAPIVARLIRQALHLLPGQVHRIRVQVALAQRRPDDPATVPAHRGLGVVAGLVGQLADDFPVIAGQVDIVAGIDRPDVTAAAVRPRGTLGAGLVGGGVEEVLAVGQKVGAGGTPLAGRDHAYVGPVGVHDEDLVALQAVAGGLENDPFAVGRKISFRVLAAEGELADVLQMAFVG